MRDLAVIAALYAEIDSRFEAEHARASGHGDAAAVTRIENKQRLNDQAYFILCWGQLEAEIDQACRDLIRRRRSHSDWAVRRGWDLYNPKDDRLSGLTFEDRAALLVDRSAGRGSPWAKIMSNYTLRNQIAHGRLVSDRIEVPLVVSEFYVIQAALVR